MSIKTPQARLVQVLLLLAFKMNRLAEIGILGVLTLVLTVLFSNRVGQRFDWRALRVTFFNVGQGDSALVQLPGGKTLMIDAGGGSRKWNRGERQLFQELSQRAILTLDKALVSHPDQDHALGFLGLLRGIHIQELWGRAGWEKPLWLALRGDAKNRGVSIVEINSERRWSEGGVGVRVIPGNGKVVNDSGLIVELEYAGCRILFTGDIGHRVERQFADWFRDVDILKVAHHGSKSSSTEKFLSKVKPEWAIISAGERNRYGHPHPSVLKRLRRVSADTLRTDFHREIQFEIFSDGYMQCQSELGTCGALNCQSPSD